MREKKIGDTDPLSKDVKEQYKANFENILNGIMASPSKAKKQEQELEVVIKLKKSNLTGTKQQSQQLFSKEKEKNKNKKNLSSTSEESCDDFSEKAALFQYRMHKEASFVMKQPILLKKNSILAFGDNSDIEESDGLEF